MKKLQKLAFLMVVGFCANASFLVAMYDNSVINLGDEVLVGNEALGLHRSSRYAALKKEIRDVLIEFETLHSPKCVSGTCPEVDAILAKSALAITHLKEVSSRIKFEKFSRLACLLIGTLKDVRNKWLIHQDSAISCCELYKQQSMLGALASAEARLRGKVVPTYLCCLDGWDEQKTVQDLEGFMSLASVVHACLEIGDQAKSDNLFAELPKMAGAKDAAAIVNECKERLCNVIGFFKGIPLKELLPLKTVLLDALRMLNEDLSKYVNNNKDSDFARVARETFLFEYIALGIALCNCAEYCRINLHGEE